MSENAAPPHNGPARGGGEEGEKTTSIRIASYNIRNGRAGGLEAALRAMAQANVDVGVFQETKLTDGIYVSTKVQTKRMYTFV
eukprot:scaffold105604_cov49-Attheya_sp.AAC.1